MKKIYLSIILLLGFAMPTFSQTYQEEQLANEYLQNGEYAKALPFFKKFYENEPKNRIYYKNYVDCLIKTDDSKEAEKVIKKQVRDFPRQQTYKIDLGEYYRNIGDTKKSKSIFEDAIKDMPPYADQVEELAACFLLIGETDYAINTYMKGRRIVGDLATFHYSIAELYATKNDYEKMTSELIEVLKVDPFELEALKSALLTILDENPESQLNVIFREAVLKEIQKNPNDVTYSDLLIWLMLQQKNYEGAFIQTKAIDKRLKEEGLRVAQLSNTCLENRKYDIALKCYEYIMSLGPAGSPSFYFYAKMNFLSTKYAMLTEDYSASQVDLLNLEKTYLESIEELQSQENSVKLSIELAHLQAFYLNKTSEATKRLTEIANRQSGKPEEIALAKMELADILILQGDMWEPALLYGQVEKDFKQDIIGQEAKFKNAKLSFYRCEFEWAQTQMDVLKASTTKLIANDALALSILIMDISGMDTTFEALATYARADLYFYQGKFDESEKSLDSLEAKYTGGHPVLDDAMYMKANIALKRGEYEKAIGYFGLVVSKFPDDILVDDALFKMGDLYERKMHDPEKAAEAYKKIIKDHRDSIYTVEARKRFNQLKGETLN
jgi:tetratricopeptide (TPR) repeat protein